MRLLYLILVPLLSVMLHLLPTTMPPLPAATLHESNDVVNPADTFPVPPSNKNMLFYVQRTHNTNTIIYELNYNADSTLNETDPVRMYWIRYADGGGIKDLSYIQQHYAYGLEASIINKEKQNFRIHFVSYKKRDIYLMRAKDNRYHAFMSINGKMSLLSRIFAKIDGGTFWVPHITYVEISGKDVETMKPVYERIIP